MTQIPTYSPASTVRSAAPTDADAIARTHKRCFARPWTADFWREEAKHGTSRLGLVGVGNECHGFVFARIAVGEAEILSVAVDPAARRQGLALRLLEWLLEQLREANCNTVFLEVAADNIAGRCLYRRSGFVEVGQRSGYYRMPSGQMVDAIVMRYDFELEQGSPKSCTSDR